MNTPLEDACQQSYIDGYTARENEQEFVERVLNTQTMAIWVFLSFLAGMLFTHFVLG